MDSANAASVVSPKKTNALTQRLLSVAVLLPLILLVIYWGLWPVVFITASAAVICLLEIYNALKSRGYHPRFVVGLLTALALCATAMLQGTATNNIAGGVFALIILFALIAELPPRDRAGTLEGWALTFASACYIGWLLSHYILLRALETPLTDGWLAFLQMPSGAAWVYLVLAITWIQDTMAYLVGRTLGRHKMAPYLSPNKSWEGAIGGIGSAVVLAMLAVPLLGLPIWPSRSSSGRLASRI
jgi:phosphatidate cytidylyltransferase